jgi:hypothetical protein
VQRFPGLAAGVEKVDFTVPVGVFASNKNYLGRTNGESTAGP